MRSPQLQLQCVHITWFEFKVCYSTVPSTSMVNMMYRYRLKFQSYTVYTCSTHVYGGMHMHMNRGTGAMLRFQSYIQGTLLATNAQIFTQLLESSSRSFSIFTPYTVWHVKAANISLVLECLYLYSSLRTT